MRDIITDLPAGFAGAPTSAPTCSYVRLREGSGQCPIDSQVGFTKVDFAAQIPLVFSGWVPVYNMEPAPGDVATFAFNLSNVVTSVHIHVRSGSDYGVRAEVRYPSTYLPVAGSTFTLWGVPGDPRHDALRGHCLDEHTGEPTGASCPANSPPRPFLTNSTDCSAGTQTATLEVDSYEEPGVFDTATATSPGVTGCDKLPFNPSITFNPSTHSADSPTGLAIDVHVPQTNLPFGVATANLKKSVTVLPEGMAVNPAAADGLSGCSEEQIGLHSTAPPSCPDSSKIGTLEIDSELLPEPLYGFAYQAKQDANPSHSTLAFYTWAEGAGMDVKLAAKVVTDPVTGQITTVFDNNPKLAFNDFKLTFDSGPRAPLVTPPACGTYTGSGEFVPWSAVDPQNPTPAEVVHSTSAFQITSGPGGGPCPSGSFGPSFSAGSQTPIAGAFSPFTLRVAREDGSQGLSRIETTLPPGMLGTLKGIPYCSDAAIASIPSALGSGAAELASPSCPAASLVGHSDAAAGPGALPFHNTGSVYLAGPYEGAPLSLAIVTPVIGGPLDLGNVVVRAALRVDPTTTQITAVSDPLPRILAGIPLDIRSVTVSMDRPDFTFNPTSCNPMAVTGLATSSQGATAPLSERFQVGACGALGFKPSLSLALKGKPQRTQHPALRAVLSFPKSGDFANIARAAVTLPHAEIIDQAHVGNPCTRPQFAEGRCPKISVLGTAKAWTPLLDKPLEGKVYFRSNGGERELPDIVADLNGQIHVVLVGAVDTVTPKTNARIRTTFFAVPDAPVSRFQLQLKGGKEGLLVNSQNLCASTQRAVVRFTAQNGKLADSEPLMQTSCGRETAKRHRQGRLR
ncbi:MAG TPA: hypothetical protein VMT37_11605 [Solirubrobacterales bacterium]|nr:hypothetical protein [Solirubrobacterales bacterium]